MLDILVVCFLELSWYSLFKFNFTHWRNILTLVLSLSKMFYINMNTKYLLSIFIFFSIPHLLLEIVLLSFLELWWYILFKFSFTNWRNMLTSVWSYFKRMQNFSFWNFIFVNSPCNILYTLTNYVNISMEFKKNVLQLYECEIFFVNF